MSLHAQQVVVSHSLLLSHSHFYTVEKYLICLYDTTDILILKPKAMREESQLDVSENLKKFPLYLKLFDFPPFVLIS